MHRFPVLPLALLLVACGGGQPSSGTAAGSDLPEPDVTGTEARALIADGAVLLDVSPPVRAEQSAIEGRTHIPLPELADRMSELPRDRTIVVYCFGGRGSPRAAQMLRDEGFDVRLLGARARWDDT